MKEALSQEMIGSSFFLITSYNFGDISELHIWSNVSPIFLNCFSEKILNKLMCDKIIIISIKSLTTELHFRCFFAFYVN